MTSSQPTATRGVVVPANGDALAIDPSVVEAYRSMLDSVPDATGEGMDGILRQLLEAGDPAELDAPWESIKLEAYRNVPIVIRSIRKAPSDYDGGLPYFLILDAAVAGTGELVTLTTGAVSVVAQLARAWAMGALPLKVIPRQSDRPSKAGYFPQHLEVAR